MDRLLSHRKHKTGYMPKTMNVDKRAEEIAKSGGQAVVYFDERAGRSVRQVNSIEGIYQGIDFIYGTKMNDKKKVIKIYPKHIPAALEIEEKVDAYVENVEFTAADV